LLPLLVQTARPVNVQLSRSEPQSVSSQLTKVSVENASKPLVPASVIVWCAQLDVGIRQSKFTNKAENVTRGGGSIVLPLKCLSLRAVSCSLCANKASPATERGRHISFSARHLLLTFCITRAQLTQGSRLQTVPKTATQFL
jgi:hypothetical protein